ncbi:hypothetical protein C8R44DRAFT_871399 [Mycena epipterygia]|nr:hypothetical protein C8R44DRAFT_871399 [Mycena epipterygia]
MFGTEQCAMRKARAPFSAQQALIQTSYHSIATPSRQQELRTTPLLSDAPVDGWGWAPKKPSPRSKDRTLRSSPYIGLASAVLKHTYHPAPITNFPGLLTHVNASASGETCLQTPQWASNFGTIYSEDRMFIVQSGVRLEFRTIDFGMETCVLTLATNTSASVSPLPLTLAIWALAARAPLSPHTSPGTPALTAGAPRQPARQCKYKWEE